MTAVSVDKLYQHYEVLQDAIRQQKIGDCTKEYEDIIETGSKGGDKEKLLAVQFISKFFKYFPSLQFQAIEALFDTCEDDNMSIRKTAMKVLPSLCKGAKEHTHKVADILAQLLQLEDAQEHAIAMNSLCEVIRIDPMLALKGFFKQVCAGEDIVHEKCIKFMAQKFPTLGSSVMTKEVEDYVFSEIKRIVGKNRTPLENFLKDTNTNNYMKFKVCSSEDLVNIMEYLAGSRFVSTPAGQLDYVQICVDQAELNNTFEPSDVDKILICTDYALPYFSAQIDSSKFLIYICDQILPQWKEIKNIDERGEKLLLRLLQQLAQMSPYCGPLKTPMQQVQNIFEVLKAYMPLPPENVEVNTLPLQEFSFVESLIYTFHQLARQCPEFLTQNPALLKDFRIRLQYFSRGVQGCIKTLNEGKGPEENRAKLNAFKVTTNINTLIKDLFYTPPNFKSVVKLSFLTIKKTEATKTETKPTPTKRHAPITIDFDRSAPSHNKQRKNTENMKIYTPPSGKFSNNFQNQVRKPGRGRGRGGYKGRGGSRGNWRK